MRTDADGHCLWCPVVEQGLQDIAESPLGEAIAEKGAQIAGGIGAGLAAGWASSKGLGAKALELIKSAAPGAMMTDLPSREYAENMLRLSENVGDETPTSNPSKPGTLGKPDHRATVEEERERLKGDAEVTIKTPGGKKNSRRADAVGTNPHTGSPEIVQVFRPTRGGKIPKREIDAASDIENVTGIKPTMVPVRPLPKWQTSH